MTSRRIAAFLLKNLGRAGATDERAVSDRELLRRFADERDERAFTQLVERHAALVWRVCHGIVANEHDAEDVFQATFLVLARKAASSGWRESVANWLYETAHRLACKARAAGWRQAVRLGQLEDKLSAPESADDMTMREAREVLYDELATLPENLRTPLVLCYLEGATREQAARQLGWSQRTLERRLEQGRARLGKRLERRGIGLMVLLLTGAGLTQGALGAGMPLALPAATVKAALAFAVSGSAGACVSVGAAALANGVLRSVFLAKASLWVAALAMVAAAAGGGVGLVLVEKAPETRPEEAESASPPEAAVLWPEPVARLDRQGDPLPPGALARLGTMRLRHDAGVLALAFTPDGNKLVTAGGDNFPRLWDTANGKLIREFRNIPKPQIIDGKYVGISAAVMSPDGRLLAVRSGRMGNLYLLETATGKRLYEFQGAENWNRAAVDFAFSPDGKTIAAQLNDRLEVREWATGGLLWQKNEKYLVRLAFSPDGKILASAAGSGGVRLWDARTGEPLREIGPKWLAGHIAFAPDSRTLAVAYRQSKDRPHPSVSLWDTATGQQIRQLGGSDKDIDFPVFSPDGQIIAAWEEGEETSLVLWETATGKELRRCVHTHDFHWHGPAAFAPDGKVLAALDGPLVRFWDAASGQERPSRLPQGHESGVSDVVFTHDGRTLISAGGDAIRWWDAQTGQQRLGVPSQLKLGSYYGSAKAALSPDGKVLAQSFPVGQEPGVVRLWDTATGKRYEHELAGTCPAFSRDGSILVTFAVEDRMDKTICFWETATGKKIQAIHTDEMIRGLALSPDGKTLAAASINQIALYPLSGGKPSGAPRWIASFHPGRGVIALAFAPDGRMLASSSSDRTIRLWDTAGGKELARFPGHGIAAPTVYPSVLSLAFSADGRRLASGDADGTILLWDVAGLARKFVRAAR
jgi:RNA polymerase sigma factor (sigma-70 family)